MTSLENDRKVLNPRGVHVIRGSDRLARSGSSRLGPLVQAKDGAIPIVRHGALLPLDKIDIIGKTEIGEFAGIRRESIISGTVDRPSILKPYAIIMDYCRVEGSTFDAWAGLAHRGVSLNAEWGEGAFANIQVTLNGTADRRIIVQPGAYLGPGVTVPAGATIYNNYYYAGDPAIILPNTPLDPDTFEPITDRRIRKGGTIVEANGDSKLRPIAFTQEQLVNGADPRALFRLDRPDMLPFGNFNITELGRNGIDAWLKKVGRDLGHKPTLGNWLHLYPLMQLTKQIAYVNEDARTYGNIAWSSAALQSEVLHLNRARQFLEAVKAPTKDLDLLIQAKLYLLGAAEPFNDTDARRQNEAYQTQSEIIKRALSTLESISPTTEIVVAANETIDNLSVSTSGQATTRVTLESQGLTAYFEQILRLPDHGPVTQVPARSANTNRQNDVPQWIEDLNPQRVDFTAIGPRVHAYHGHVPVIAPGAILLGRADVSGAVEIGDGVILRDGSFRSEQSIAPLYITGNTYIGGNTIVHIATKEMHPGSIGAKGEPAVIEDAQVHGALIHGFSYIAKGAVIGDEAAHIGVTAPDALNPGQATARAGGPLEFTAGNWATGAFDRQNGDIQYPLHHQQFTKWWAASPFSDIEIGENGPDHEAVKTRIRDIQARHAETARNDLAELTEEYGPLYPVSTPLQAAALNLQHAAQILDSHDWTSTAQEIRQLAEGVEYLLGMRTLLSRGAAAQLNHKNIASILQPVIRFLESIADEDGIVSVEYWDNNSPTAMTYEKAQKLVTGSIRPVTALEQRNFEVANDPAINPTGRDHVMTAEKTIATKLPARLDFYPAQISLLARQIEGISELVQNSRDSIENGPNARVEGQRVRSAEQFQVVLAK